MSEEEPSPCQKRRNFAQLLGLHRILPLRRTPTSPSPFLFSFYSSFSHVMAFSTQPLLSPTQPLHACIGQCPLPLHLPPYPFSPLRASMVVPRVSRHSIFSVCCLLAAAPHVQCCNTSPLRLAPPFLFSPAREPHVCCLPHSHLQLSLSLPWQLANACVLPRSATQWFSGDPAPPKPTSCSWCCDDRAPQLGL